MSKTKILNLDDFVTESGRTLTIKGKTYDVVDMTVENFIATSKEAKRLGEDADTHDKVDATVQMIKRSIPTVDEAVLRELSLVKLGVIVQFIQGDLDEQMDQAAQEGAAVGDDAVKK